jgi:hypothetical protein
MNTEARRQELLAALERQFPEADPFYRQGQDDQAESDQGAAERVADTFYEQAAQQLGHPISPNTPIGLTRGQHAEERVIELRRELDRARTSYEGGDITALEIELHHATDQLQELEMTGQADSVIELARSRSTTVYGPTIRTPMRPTR